MRLAKPKFRHALAILWLLCTLSLAAWWLIFGLRQAARLSALDHSQSGSVVREQRMLVGEGSFLLLVVLGGGIGLIVLSHHEAKRREEMQHFLSGFTHELKTSLASIRLQSEILMEEEPSSPGFLRLLREIVRLEIQLENSLLLARADVAELYPEEIRLSEIVDKLKPLWPGLTITQQGDSFLRGDRRALESIFKNLIQNAYHHGEATSVALSVESERPQVRVLVRDNGHGFQGKKELLGKAFFRHNGRSGSGLGLYLSRTLLRRMDGELAVTNAPQGFAVEIYLGGHS